MKDFENVDRYDVDCEGYMADFNNGGFVLYSDYKDLLDAYKELLWMREELEK